MRRRQINLARDTSRQTQNEEQHVPAKLDSEEAPVAAVKRKRGRPRKVKDDDVS